MKSTATSNIIKMSFIAGTKGIYGISELRRSKSRNKSVDSDFPSGGMFLVTELSFPALPRSPEAQPIYYNLEARPSRLRIPGEQGIG